MRLRQKNVISGFLFLLLTIFLSVFYILEIFFYQEKPEHWKPVSLPELHDPIHLRVVYADNHRFKSLTPSQIDRVLDKAAELVKLHFEKHVVFEKQPNISVQSLFNVLPFMAKRYQSEKVISIRKGQLEIQSLKRISASISKQLQHQEDTSNALINYARPYLIESNDMQGLDELTAELTKTFVYRHQIWIEQSANDGKPVLDGSPYNQWIFWDALGYGDLPYDIVLTNQLVASAEDNGMPLHTCLRGGISGGNMTYSKQGRLGGFVFVSAFQMINDNDLLGFLRDDASYTEQQIIDYTAATLTHELGHLLFHYGHPFDVSSCIMSPTPLLRYREWYEKLDVQACKDANSPFQRPGAARITYNSAW